MQQLLENAIEHISNAVAPTISDSDPLKQIFCMKYPGVGIDPQEYDPNTPVGQRNLALLCDPIPHKTKLHSESATTVSQEYSKVLLVRLPPDIPPTTQEEREYQDAKAKLQEPGYQQYEEALMLYEYANRMFYKARNEPGTTDDDLRRLWNDVERRYRGLILADKGVYEEALTVVKYYGEHNGRAIVFDAAQVFERAKIPGPDPFYNVRATPQTWASDAALAVGGHLAWTTVNLTGLSATVVVHSAYRRLNTGFKAEVHGAFWSAGVSAGWEDVLREANGHASADKVRLRMEIAVVDIQRPWFRGGLLYLPQACLDGYPQYGLCSGDITTVPGGSFDIRPTRLVLVRNVTITNSLHTTEFAILEEHRSAFVEAGGSYCGFSFSSDFEYEKGSRDTTRGNDYYACKITMPKPQLIGYVCALNPAFPPDHAVVSYAAAAPRVSKTTIDSKQEFEAIAIAEQQFEFIQLAMPMPATPGHH
jgi:hypothetical protein